MRNKKTKQCTQQKKKTNKPWHPQKMQKTKDAICFFMLFFFLDVFIFAFIFAFMCVFCKILRVRLGPANISRPVGPAVTIGSPCWSLWQQLLGLFLRCAGDRFCSGFRLDGTFLPGPVVNRHPCPGDFDIYILTHIEQIYQRVQWFQQIWFQEYSGCAIYSWNHCRCWRHVLQTWTLSDFASLHPKWFSLGADQTHPGNDMYNRRGQFVQFSRTLGMKLQMLQILIQALLNCPALRHLETFLQNCPARTLANHHHELYNSSILDITYITYYI